MKSLHKNNLSKPIFKCFKCNKLLPKREFLTCSQCKLSYDLHCANVSIQRFNNTMTQDHKAAWKCMTCFETINERSYSNYKTLKITKQLTESNNFVVTENAKIQSQNSSYSEFVNCNENITMRRQKEKVNVSTHNSFQSLPTEDEEDLSLLHTSQLKTVLNRSCPEIDTILNVREELDILKMELKDTKHKLLKAENIIDKLEAENSNLQKQILQCELKIEKINRICTSTDLNDSKSNSTIDRTPTFTLTNTLQKKKKKPQNFASTPKSRKENTHSKQNHKNSEQHKNISEKNIYKKKVCVVSTNNTNKLLSISKKTLGDEFELCHYIKPKCGILQILHGIHSKVKRFTKKDYCIIMMGHEDFRSSVDYYALVKEIKHILHEISHTNILLCLPVFKCGRYCNSVMNWRIESFNKALYEDIQTHANYPCHIVDSNLHLSYDDFMFNSRTGLLKNYGMRIIFEHIFEMMYSLFPEEFNTCQEQLYKNENLFFR